VESTLSGILVIEPDQALQDTLVTQLQRAGHRALRAGTGQEGLALGTRDGVDLVLLDLTLPDRPGTEVCRALRKDDRTHALPIIALAQKDDEIDRIVAFELGVDDCVTKPFSHRELLLRIQAILRNRRGPAPPNGVLKAGAISVDLGSHRAWVDDRALELTVLEFKLLAALVSRKERVQSREVLLADVWNLPGGLKSRTVDTHVKRLRQRLGHAGDQIVTVRGVGYRLSDRRDAG